MEKITHKPTAFVKSSHGINDSGDIAILTMKNMVLIVTRNGTWSFLDQNNPFIKTSEVSKSGGCYNRATLMLKRMELGEMMLSALVSRQDLI